LAASNLSIGQCKQFASVLTEQLASLDGTNIASIMESEQQVNELIGHIDSALGQADEIGQALDEYDQILSFVSYSVELIEEKESLRQTELLNLNRLHSDLAEFLALLDTASDPQIEALRLANLSDPKRLIQ
jgi:hypothetical protein